MAATGKRTITLSFYGDLGGASPGLVQPIVAADNNASPAQVQIVTLAIGDNTITVPASGTTAKACTIVKPAANEVAIKLKGNAGDTGVRLHDTDPDTISLNAAQTTFILNVAAEVVGVRLWWT